MKTLTTVLLALTVTAGGMSAQAGQVSQMNDLEIAHTAYTAGALDIRYAHLALALSEDASVHAFANTMIRDHAAVNDAAGALLAELKAAPQDNDLSKALVAGAAETRASLMKLSGHAFDCAYAKNELGYHQLVNETVEDGFIPAVTVAPLKELLVDALATFKVHEGHAEKMVAGLKCDS